MSKEKKIKVSLFNIKSLSIILSAIFQMRGLEASGVLLKQIMEPKQLVWEAKHKPAKSGKNHHKAWVRF